jgi:hypothetical protein
MIPNHIKKAIAKWLIAGLEKIEQDYYKEARELNDQMVRQAKNKSQVSVSSRHLIWNENIDMEGRIRGINKSLANITRWIIRINAWGKL